MRKLLPTAIFILFALLSVQANAQQISIGNIDVGPYGQGSSIAVPISVPANVGSFAVNNSFKLYLSDENGNFGNTVIGESSGFFSTHINGVIPAGALGSGNYKLKVVTTNPVREIIYPGTISIIAAAGPVVGVTPSNPAEVLAPGTYGWCGSTVGNNKSILLQQESNSVASTLVLKNELTGATQTITPTALGFNLDNLPLSYYTVTISGETQVGPNLIKSNKTYLLLNTPSKVNIQSNGIDYGCIDPAANTGAQIVYSVNISGASGIQDNYPGSIYAVTWGDGVENNYTHYELLANNGIIAHNYTRTSCGEPEIDLGNGNVITNSYRVSVTTLNPFCQSNSLTASTYPKIFSKPVARIDPNAIALLANTPGVINNSSTKGNNSDCSSNIQWKWYVDGVFTTDAENLNYTGFAPGTYTIKLLASNDVGACGGPSEDTRVICVQNAPQPSFNFSGASGATICAPTVLKPTNTSILDENCNTEKSYLWTVTGGTVTGDLTTREPNFGFTTPGVYKITLSITTLASSAVTTQEQTVIVNAPPAALLSPAITLCNLTTYNFNDSDGPTKTSLTGTFETLADTYTWTVTSSGTYEFVNSTISSQYPTILFKDNTSYVIKVVHKNTCGTTESSQTITFRAAPVVNAGTYQAACYKDPISLSGQISGSVDSYEWIGLGTFFPNNTDLNAVYTPTDAERTAGHADLILRAHTLLAAPCNIIEGYTTITIRPLNIITSNPAKTICTGKPVSYTPVAVAGSTFKWTATGSPGTSGFGPGNGAAIADVLSNSDANAPATVTYKITPVVDGCEGQEFELIVTITPNPTVTPTRASASICSGSLAGITLASNQDPNVTYLWSSATSGGQITGNTENLTTPAAITEINDVLVNNGTAPGNVTYIFTPVSAGGCFGTPVSIDVAVKSSPNLGNNSISQNQIRCEDVVADALIGTVPTGGDNIYVYQWQSSPDATTWTDIQGATSKDFSPGILTATTHYRRTVTTLTCAVTSMIISNEATITINYKAKAEFTFQATTSCPPFSIDGQNIKAIPYPDRNATYTWFANNVQIGTGIAFPGYIINDFDEQVEIKLEATSSNGCSAPATQVQIFSTPGSNNALFTPSVIEGCGPLTVTFTNQSTLPPGTTFNWDFGNGVSELANPAPVTFLPDPTGDDKVYTVSLIATTPCGSTTPYIRKILVRAKTVARFSPSVTEGCSPLKVIFTNTSPDASNTTYTFDYGDGSVLDQRGTDRSPAPHDFPISADIKTYTVKMTANGTCGGADTKSFEIRVLPNNVVASLVVNGPELKGCAPHTVSFNNESKGATRFEYDFGDGTEVITSFSQDVITHTFKTGGNFQVKMRAYNDCSTGEDNHVKIDVTAQPKSEFTADNLEGCADLEVQFTDNSIDAVTYLWDFGDGSPTSNLKNPPAHTYDNTQEYYTVTLTTTNSLGCPQAITKTNYIHILQPPLAQFEVEPGLEIQIPTYTFRFSDFSTRNPTKWLWDFGDGSPESTEKNPRHTYSDAGSYLVTLVVTNQTGCTGTISKTVKITGTPGYLQLPNSFIPGHESAEFREFSAKGMGLKSWKLSIFSKWGELLWETTKLDAEGKPTEGWDGKFKGVEMPQGVYFWKADVQFINGSSWKGMTYDKSAPKRTGTIYLIR